MTKKERMRRNHTKSKGGKKRWESPDARFNRHNRAHRMLIRERARIKFREEFTRNFSLKAMEEGKPIVIVRKLLKKALWLMEGTRYA